MGKKYQSGVFLGETRRQRTARMRHLCIAAAVILLTVLGSLFFVSWLLDRADHVQTGHPTGEDLPPITGQTDAVTESDTAAETASDVLPSETEAVTAPSDKTSDGLVVPIAGEAYKPLDYTGIWSVMIDPGHGFDDIGTSSALLGDVNEATVNLDIALRVRELLAKKQDMAIIMTHEDNAVDGRISAADGGEPPLNRLVLLTPEDRAVLANGQDIDLFVSVHCDSLPENPTVSGMRVYYYDGGEQAEQRNRGAACLASNIANEFGLVMDGSTPTPLVKTMSDDDAFYVIKKIGVPSVLCEVGFVTNETDAANMLDEGWRQMAAEAIASGIASYIDGCVRAETLS